ncbi:methyl-accepting chemotaxis protein [Uliginosibacterium sp. 31-16]|uniref:methyl-accepting chemotaxis protein n=1 Tax=Uliginosibacterium sp. 31-16 TaxID=3068315 RepID=UPI00273F79DE|nr:methyl-accepting chemotaxis protein [Uliginosibacterium sp. 31-16]MDP5238020.1 methyl-accepting chemotaxis protein [Uliginosibacterium sp. 31-16]
MLDTLLSGRSLRFRLLLAPVAALLCFMLFGFLSLKLVEYKLRQDKQQQLIAVVELAHSVVERYQKLESAGTLSHELAQESARQDLKAMRYAGTEYLWINDMGLPVPSMVMHPTVPALDGTRLDKDSFNKATSLYARDGSGQERLDNKNLFVSAVQTVSKHGDGFVTYEWPKPKQGGGVTETLFPKLSYVKGFAPWNWVIGSGVYIDDLDAAFWQLALIIGALTVGVSLLMLAVAILARKSILGQLGGEPAFGIEIMNRVAEGDMKVQLASAPAGSMLASLGLMVARLREMIGEIVRDANTLGDSSVQLARSSQEIATASVRQADATASMAAAMEELTVSINIIASSSGVAEAASQQAASQARAGVTKVGETTESMESISSSVGLAGEQIRQLDGKAREISGIASEIKEIAGQTNLLALNAAIEAARAGEQGRGFAVVADEVRKLAERTANATVSIEKMLTAVQDDTRSVVVVMKEIRPQVDAGVQLIRAVAVTLSDINSGSESSLSNLRDVASATREQGVASNSIAMKVEEVSQMAEQTSSTISIVADSASSIERVALNLNRQVGRFKI